MKHILIVANQTASGEHLRRVVRARIHEGACRFTLLVPATAPPGHLTWTEHAALEEANARLDEALAGLRALGAQVDGLVGDRRPILAIDDFLRTGEVDEIIVSTLPVGASRWLRQDLPRRVARTFDVKVTHVVEEPAPAAATAT